jgi:lysophospholipase L1-like esterase
MKKYFILLLGLLVSSYSLLAQSKVYDINADFESGVVGTAFDWGLSGDFGTNSKIQNASGGQITGITYGKVLDTNAGSATASREGTKDLGVLRTDNEGRMWLEFDWQVNNHTNPLYDNGNGGYLYFKDADDKLILGFNIEKSKGDAGNNFHVLNLDPTVNPLNDPTNDNTRIEPTNGKGNFTRKQSWAHIYAVLNFTTNTIDTLRISNHTGALYENNALAFHDAEAGLLRNFVIRFNRAASNAGYWRPQFDNFQIYHLSSNVADVTVNYLDAEGNPIAKDPKVFPNQGVGGNFAAPAEETASFVLDGYYYAYDKAATIEHGGDQVEVSAGGSSLNLRFKKSALKAATYFWTGTSNALWNDLDDNFTTDQVSDVNYQVGNPVEFPESGNVKEVSIVNDFNMSDKDIQITGTNYSFSGAGILTGSGSWIVDPGDGNTSSLNILNLMSGGVHVQSGTVELLRGESASTLTMADASGVILDTKADFSTAINGSGTINLNIASDKVYGSIITGASRINIGLDVAGALSGASWTSQFKFSYPSDAVVNVSTSLASAGFSVNDNTAANVNLNLSDHVRLFRFYNQNANNNDNVQIGSLSGAESSTLEGGFVGGRTLTYSVGETNSDAVFAGTFKNFREDGGDVMNIKKRGSGNWTLSGDSHEGYVNGTLTVESGKLILTGRLGAPTVPVVVNPGAILAGTGSIDGTVTVDGNLEGSLNIGSLVMGDGGSIDLHVRTFDDFDQLTITDLQANGVLNIQVDKAPEVGAEIQILHAENTTGVFSDVQVSGYGMYSFDVATGKLTCLSTTGISPILDLNTYQLNFWKNIYVRTFVIQAENLSDNIVLQAPVGVTLSVSQITPVDGVVAPTTIEVRYDKTSLIEDADIIISSTGISDKIIKVNAEPSIKKITVFTIGDSTMANRNTSNNNRERGWGQLFGFLFDPEIVAVSNHATSGRSTKSFINEGRWNTVYNQLKADDYVLMQFGHNDQKSGESSLYAPAWGAYIDNLARFVNETRQKGANPVILTSIIRRQFDGNGVLQNTLEDYPEAARYLADSLQVPLIDMYEKTFDMVQKLGPNNAGVLYVNDITHLCEYGAVLVAQQAATGIRELSLPLAEFLIDDIHPMSSPFNNNYEDVSSYLTNPDFELQADNVSFAGTSAVRGVPYGWQQTGTLAGNAYGINYTGASNRQGKGFAWYSASEAPFALPEDFELYQTVEDLPSGEYLIRCRLAVKNPYHTNVRLFANQSVQYYGNYLDYTDNLTEGESRSFASYVPNTGSSNEMKEMVVKVTVQEGETLRLGIKSSHVTSTGEAASGVDNSGVYGAFSVDYFRLEKLNNVEVGFTSNPAQLPGIKAYGVAGAVKLEITDPVQINIHSITGQLVYAEFISQDKSIQLLPGVYIVNSKKVLVR